MLRIHEIKLNIDESMDEIPDRIKKKLGMADTDISYYKVMKESIDARDKGDIKLVYTVDFTLEKNEEQNEKLEEMLLSSMKNIKLEKAPDLDYHYVVPGTKKMGNRPVIVGFGPCGMFAALILSEMGYRPIIIERGKSIEERVKDVNSFWENGVLNEESNVQFGEGGAGAFSDGKLTTQIKDPRVRKVLEEFVGAGGSSELLYKQKPHIGTDVLRTIVTNIRKKVIENGGEIYFESKLTSVEFNEENGIKKLKSVTVNGEKVFHTEDVIIAIGHSARDTFRILNEQGINMQQKPFSMGVRIEHPQVMINETQYGRNWEKYELGAADYKLAHHCKNGRGVYTFCMCPGGHVIAAASQVGGVVTNGMSFNDRAGLNANSGLLVDVRTEDFQSEAPLAGIAFQEKYEKLAFEAGGGNYNAPAQRLGDFMGKGQRASSSEVKSTDSTYLPGITWTELSKCLPDFVVESIREAIPVMSRKLRGFDMKGAILTGVETRSSSPVRIVRDENYMSSIQGLYPGGEGAGYAGGIVSASVDGIKIAEEIAGKYEINK